MGAMPPGMGWSGWSGHAGVSKLNDQGAESLTLYINHKKLVFFFWFGDL